MKAVVAAFNQEKALVGAFSVIANLRMELFQALLPIEGVLGPVEHGAQAVGEALHQVPAVLPLLELHPVWADVTTAGGCVLCVPAVTV